MVTRCYNITDMNIVIITKTCNIIDIKTVMVTRGYNIIDIKIVFVTKGYNIIDTNKVIISGFITAAKKIQLQVKYSDVFCSNNKNTGGRGSIVYYCNK